MKEIHVQALLGNNDESATFQIMEAPHPSGEGENSIFTNSQMGMEIHVHWQPHKPDNEQEWKEAIKDVVQVYLEQHE